MNIISLKKNVRPLDGSPEKEIAQQQMLLDLAGFWPKR
jgi:hypothetical protein